MKSLRVAALLMIGLVVLIPACGTSQPPATSTFRTASPSTSVTDLATPPLISSGPASATPAGESVPPTSQLAQSPPPAPTSTSAATPSSAPARPRSDIARIDWRLVDGDAGLGTLLAYSPRPWPADVVADKFVLGGAPELSEEPSIWTSADGLNWTLATVEGSSGGGEIFDIAAGPSGAVAIGQLRENGTVTPTVWHSNDGTNWARVPDAAIGALGVDLVAATDAGYVALGPAGLYTSPNGTEWSPSANGPPFTNRQAALLVDGHRFTALTLDAHEKYVVWSSDGLDSWQAVGELPGSTGASLNAAAMGPRGWVALGTLGSSQEPAAWFSSDGKVWSVTTPPRRSTIVSDVIALDVGFVAVGYEQTGGGCAADPSDILGLTWTSTDGRAWTLLPHRGWSHRRIAQLLRDQRTLIGVGVDYRSPIQRDAPVGTVWTARLPASEGDSPDANDPDTAPTPGPGCGGD